MSRRLIIVLALAFVLGISFAAYAEVQNIKVSGDMEFSGVIRNNFQLNPGGNYQAALATPIGGHQSFLLSQIRARIDADLTDNVSAVLRLINESVWGQEFVDNDSEVGVDLAYVTLKEFLYSPVTLTVGRQELHFGNEMIIGDVDTNRVAQGWIYAEDLSKRKSFDSIRLTLDYDPLVIDAVYAKITEGGVGGGFGAAGSAAVTLDDDTDLWGINGRYDFGPVIGTKSVIGEAYWWTRRIGHKAFTTVGAAAMGPKDDWLNTVGARVEAVPIQDLKVYLEAAKQFGKIVALDLRAPIWNASGVNLAGGSSNNLMDVNRDAWALETGFTYTFSKMKYTPTLAGVYGYFSGDADSWGPYETWHGWDPMFENQTFGHIANALFVQTNSHVVGMIVAAKPLDDITAKLEYYNYWLAKNPSPESDANFAGWWPGYYNANGQWMNTKTGNHLGQEIDLTLTYDYTEDVQFKLLGGAFITGDVFASSTEPGTGLAIGGGGHTVASEVIGSMKVTF
jgi:hypothetical protein